MKKKDWMLIVNLVAVLVLCTVIFGKPQLLQEPKSGMLLCCFMLFYVCVISIVNFVSYRKVLANPSSEIERVHTQGLFDVALLAIIGSTLAIGVLLWYVCQHGWTMENVNRAFIWLEVLELPVLAVILWICCKVHGFEKKVHTVLKEKLNLVITESYWGFCNFIVVSVLAVNVNSIFRVFTKKYLNIAFVVDIIFVVLLAYVTVRLKEVILNELYQVEEEEQRYLYLDMLKGCENVIGVMLLLIPFTAATCIGLYGGLLFSAEDFQGAVQIVFAGIAAFLDMILVGLVGNHVRLLKTHLRLQTGDTSFSSVEGEKQGESEEN